MTGNSFRVAILMLLGGSALLTGCASTPGVDPYVLYREHMPRSILVLPPVNESVDVNAPYSWVTTASMPIAEQGYYVFPVAVIDAFMKENGLPTPEDMQTAPLDKLGEIFGADAVLYVTLEDFGQKFELVSSTTRVIARAEMVDVDTAQVIWKGRLNYAESSSNSNNSLLGNILSAAITQIESSVNDRAHDAARTANLQLFGNAQNGLLMGPLHRRYAETIENEVDADEEDTNDSDAVDEDDAVDAVDASVMTQLDS